MMGAVKFIFCCKENMKKTRWSDWEQTPKNQENLRNRQNQENLRKRRKQKNLRNCRKQKNLRKQENLRNRQNQENLNQENRGNRQNQENPSEGPLAQSVERGHDNAKVVSSRLTWTKYFSSPKMFSSSP